MVGLAPSGGAWGRNVFWPPLASRGCLAWFVAPPPSLEPAVALKCPYHTSLTCFCCHVPLRIQPGMVLHFRGPMRFDPAHLDHPGPCSQLKVHNLHHSCRAPGAPSRLAQVRFGDIVSVTTLSNCVMWVLSPWGLKWNPSTYRLWVFRHKLNDLIPDLQLMGSYPIPCRRGTVHL